MRLLIIEDERKIARIIAEALRREHHAVDVTHDGDEGLNMAMSEPYDLLVVDRMLPGRSGTDIVQDLRGQGKDMPILLLTALGTTEDKTFGLDSGADDYLVKPFAIAELTARVRALLDQLREGKGQVHREHPWSGDGDGGRLSPSRKNLLNAAWSSCEAESRAVKINVTFCF